VTHPEVAKESGGWGEGEGEGAKVSPINGLLNDVFLGAFATLT